MERDRKIFVPNGMEIVTEGTLTVEAIRKDKLLYLKDHKNVHAL